MSTPTRTAAPRRPSNRRELVIDAAAGLFARRGFDGVSVADIAEAVGVTAPALYRHFANKEAILTSLVLDTVERLQAAIVGPDDADATLGSTLQGAVVEVLERPTHIATYLRERHRLRGADAKAQAERERSYLGLFATHVARETEGVSGAEIRVRIVGAIGVLHGVALRPHAMPRPGLDDLLVGAVSDLLTCPPAPQVPETPRPTAAWSPERSPRSRILAAALPLLRARGFGGVGIGEIGDAAGIGASNVHRYYESKHDILVDLYDRVGARVEVAFDDAASAAADAGDALDRVIDAYCRIAFDAADLVVVVSQNRGALPASERPRLRRRDARTGDLLRSAVAGIRPDLRPTEVSTLAASVLPLVNMYPQQQLVDLPAPAVVAHLARALVSGGPVSGSPVPGSPVSGGGA